MRRRPSAPRSLLLGTAKSPVTIETASPAWRILRAISATAVLGVWDAGLRRPHAQGPVAVRAGERDQGVEGHGGLFFGFEGLRHADRERQSHLGPGGSRRRHAPSCGGCPPGGEDPAPGPPPPGAAVHFPLHRSIPRTIVLA